VNSRDSWSGWRVMAGPTSAAQLWLSPPPGGRAVARSVGGTPSLVLFEHTFREGRGATRWRSGPPTRCVRSSGCRASIRSWKLCGGIRERVEAPRPSEAAKPASPAA